MGYERLEYLYVSLSGVFLVMMVYIWRSRSKLYRRFNEVRGDDKGEEKESLLGSQIKLEGDG